MNIRSKEEKRMMYTYRSSLIKNSRSMAMPLLLLHFHFLLLLHYVQSCNQLEQRSLLSFHRSILANPPSLNWNSSTDCCYWQGIACRIHSAGVARVTHLLLPNRNLSSAPDFTINSSTFQLPFLVHINLSHNHFSTYPLPLASSSLPRLQTLDLSYNSLSGNPLIYTFSLSVQTLDLSSNHFNASLISPPFLLPNLISFNISNNSFSGPLPTSSICKASSLVRILDFSINRFTAPLSPAGCVNLQVLRAGSNSLSGLLPNELYQLKELKEISLPNNQLSGPIHAAITNLSGLVVLELHVNQLSGELPSDIGLLSNLEQLQLHSNNLNGTLPPSLMNCSNLTTVLLRNNLFQGQISALDFSKLRRLQALDLGNNSFVGEIPHSLCFCRSLSALRLAYNRLTGELPPCMASLTSSLTHLSLSDNYLSNVVGALLTLRHCDNLAVLFLSRCFHRERMPDDNDLLHLTSFRNLQILTLGGCQLQGQIPNWISNLRKLKVLNLSFNKISGPIPAWLGSMPSLFVLNLTQNYLWGEIPRQIGRLPALISDNSSTDLSHLALPFLYDSLQYNRLFNLPRGLKLGNNSLSGAIPAEIGELKLLHTLDLSLNRFNGGIPGQLSRLSNLERLDLSGNDLSGEIPESLTELHFLSAFSVAENDLEGEIPRGGQFETFGAAAFEGNPKLCGYVINRTCNSPRVAAREEDEDEDEGSWWYDPPFPFGVGYFVGLIAATVAFWLFNAL